MIFRNKRFLLKGNLLTLLNRIKKFNNTSHNNNNNKNNKIVII